VFDSLFLLGLGGGDKLPCTCLFGLNERGKRAVECKNELFLTSKDAFEWFAADLSNDIIINIVAVVDVACSLRLLVLDKLELREELDKNEEPFEDD